MSLSLSPLALFFVVAAIELVSATGAGAFLFLEAAVLLLTEEPLSPPAVIPANQSGSFRGLLVLPALLRLGASSFLDLFLTVSLSFTSIKTKSVKAGWVAALPSVESNTALSDFVSPLPTFTELVSATVLLDAEGFFAPSLPTLSSLIEEGLVLTRVLGSQKSSSNGSTTSSVVPEDLETAEDAGIRSSDFLLLLL